MATYRADQDELFGSGGGGGGKKPNRAKKAKPVTQPKPGRAAAPAPRRREFAPESPASPSPVDLRNKAGAEELESQAKKFVTRPRLSLFWSPEPTRAASQYEKAANKYQASGFLGKAMECFTAAATYCVQDESFGKAQSNYQKAAELAERMGKFAEAVADWRQAGECMLQCTRVGQAARMYERAAEVYQGQGKVDEAIHEWRGACALILDEGDDVATNDIGPTGHEVFGRAVEYLYAQKRWSEAVALLPRYQACLSKNGMTSTLHKTYLCHAVIELHLGDVVKAHATFMTHLGDSNYLTTGECKAEEEIVMAVKNNDANDLAQALDTNSSFRFIDRHVAELARALQVDDLDLLDGEDGQGEGEGEDELATDSGTPAAASAPQAEPVEDATAGPEPTTEPAPAPTPAPGNEAEPVPPAAPTVEEEEEEDLT